MEYPGPFLWLPPAAEGAEQGTGPGEFLTGLGTLLQYVLASLTIFKE